MSRVEIRRGQMGMGACCERSPGESRDVALSMMMMMMMRYNIIDIKGGIRNELIIILYPL